MSRTDAKELDVITIGRSSVDLYGQQIGIAAGGHRLLRQVGGRLSRQYRHRHGAAGPQIGTDHPRRRRADGALHPRADWRARASRLPGIATDPERLTALVLLAVEERRRLADDLLPLRTAPTWRCSEDDIDETFVASARAVVVTGTHFSRPHSDAAQRKAIRIAKENGGKVVFDIDYRPNLWGLAGHAEGVRALCEIRPGLRPAAKPCLPDCDLIVGTEEEIMIASGADDVLAALKAIRSLSAATIVLKRGAHGLRRL